MTIGWQQELRPGVALREIVRQATEALIRMDAERLEELARCCSDLNRDFNRDLQGPDSDTALKAAADMQASAHDLRLLERVLFETRANLKVFTRLHAMRLNEAARFQASERKVSYGDN
jgi:hypothetical protein